MLSVLVLALVPGFAPRPEPPADLAGEFRLLRQRVPNERSFAAFKALDARGYRTEATQVLGGLLLSYDSKDEENELMSVAAMLTWRGNELDAEFLCRRVRRGVGGHHIQIFQNIASLCNFGSMKMLKDVLDWKVKHDDDPVDAIWRPLATSVDQQLRACLKVSASIQTHDCGMPLKRAYRI